MIQDIKDILEELEGSLLADIQNEDDAHTGSEKAIKSIQQAILEVKHRITGDQFKNQDEEIYFFKSLLPEFYSRLIYHLHVFHMETRCPKASIKLQRKLLQNELKDIALFYQKHGSFIEYYNAGNTYLDEHYFTRDSSNELFPFLLDDCSIALDSNFCTTYCYVLSKIRAFEQLQGYIAGELQRLKSNDRVETNTITPRKWKLGPFALVELGYLIHLTGGLPGSLKSTMEYLEKCFDTKTGNYSRILQQMRIRKEDRATYLKKGMDLFYRHMDDLDDRLA